MNNHPITQLEKKIGHHFNDPKHLEEALTHKSAVSHNLHANERMEFLGDSLLSLIIADFLYQYFPNRSEGELTRSRAYFVRGDYLCKLANKIDLAPYINHNASDSKTTNQAIKPSVLANTVEALIAAIYLDTDLSTTRKCVLSWYADELLLQDKSSAEKDPKTQLQEYCQSKKIALPIYALEKINGKAHQQSFVTRCTISDQNNNTIHSSQGKGKSKQQAELDAAHLMLIELNKVEPYE
jgi:ribonuclease III